MYKKCDGLGQGFGSGSACFCPVRIRMNLRIQIRKKMRIRIRAKKERKGMNKFCRVGDVQCKQFHFFCSDFRNMIRITGYSFGKAL